MKRAALLSLLALAACGENLPHQQPPMDRFFFPYGLALTPVAGGNQALLVVSANYDLHYDKERGATLLSVDPSAYDAASGAGGSAGRPSGELVKLGQGAQLGSFTGQVAVANSTTCPGLIGPGPDQFPTAQALVASRYTRMLYRLPVGLDGSMAPCQGEACELALDSDLLDPASIGLACRADGRRRSAFVGYLRAPAIGPIAPRTAWLSELDLGGPPGLSHAPRTFPLASGPVGDMTYDALTDRLYAVGRFAGLTAPLFIVDLPACHHWATDASATSTCPVPRVQVVELYGELRGAELVGIALSNPQPGRPRLAYIAARIYDEAYALATFSRPPFDIGGALLEVELSDDVAGGVSARVRQIVPLGLGAGAVGVLPVRPGLADVVVVPSSGDGTIQVYDGEAGAVVRAVSIDGATGTPEVGRVPEGMAVEDRGSEALVYIASFADWTLSILRVPLASPGTADLLRHPQDGSSLAGKPLRIGRKSP
jgi:hypothetical protein